MSEKTSGHVCALVTILIWGTTFISTKVLLDTLTPLEILFGRFLLGYLALLMVRPRMLHCTPAAGTAEHQGLHNQIRCFSGCGSQASYCVGIRSNGTLLRPPAQAPIACTVPSAQTAFHFIQIKFKRCNVRCSVARYYLTRPEPICQIGRLHFVRCLTFFFVQF